LRSDLAARRRGAEPFDADRQPVGADQPLPPLRAGHLDRHAQGTGRPEHCATVILVLRREQLERRD
jgi:hypothetical protein